MKELIVQALEESPFQLTLQTAALLAMRVVELYNTQTPGSKLTGDEKREMCHAVVPMVLNMAYQTGRIMLETKLELDNQYEEGPTIVDALIQIAAFVSKRPEFIQLTSAAQEILETAASKCATRLCNGGSSKRRKTKKRGLQETRNTVPVTQAQAAALPDL